MGGPLSAAGRCAGGRRRGGRGLAAGGTPAPQRIGSAGRSPARGRLSDGAWCTPAPPAAPACRSWTRSGGRSTARPRSPTSAGRSPPPHLRGRAGIRALSAVGGLWSPSGSAPTTSAPPGLPLSSYLCGRAARRVRASVGAAPRRRSRPARRRREGTRGGCRALGEAARSAAGFAAPLPPSPSPPARHPPAPAAPHRCCRPCPGSTWRRAGSACGVSGRRGRAGRPHRGPPPRRTRRGRSPRPRCTGKATGGTAGTPR